MLDWDSPITSLDVFKSLFADVKELPYHTGTVALDATTSTIFYHSGDMKAEHVPMIDFANVTDGQLEALARACEPASVGVADKDVLDESYRKAGKMDASKFATHFSPLEAGIIDTIRDSLLHDRNEGKSIRAELYKLNVYEPGAFFKSHIDTPRNDTMFGTLVVIFPTEHEGGSLTFRHQGKEFTFDSTEAIRDEATPHAAFVASFSDVEHEVTEITSGYHVTLTYNLFFIDSPTGDTQSLTSVNNVHARMKAGLEELLKNPWFLRVGGLVGFGLIHKYPFKPGETKLWQLQKCLKGLDAGIKRACDALSLPTSLRAVYHDSESKGSGVYCLTQQFAQFEEDEPVYTDQPVIYLRDHCRGTLVYSYHYQKEEPEELYKGAEPIIWINPLKESNAFKAPFLGYDNEAWIGYAYGEVCLVVEIPPANERHVV